MQVDTRRVREEVMGIGRKSLSQRIAHWGPAADPACSSAAKAYWQDYQLAIPY